MAIEYSWKVNALKYGNEPGFEQVVQFADCSYVASETVGLTTYTAEERVVLELDPPSSDEYISFSEITQEMVLSWITPKVEEISRDELESKKFKLSSIIEHQKSGSDLLLSEGLPWVSDEEVPNDVSSPAG